MKYTPAGGTQELKVAICDRHKADYGTNYTPAETVISVGGKHVIALAGAVSDEDLPDREYADRAE